MDRKTFFLAALIIILISTIASAAYNSYRHSSFTVGDGKDIDLAGTSIGNGYFTGVNIGTNTSNASRNESQTTIVWTDGTNFYAKNQSNGLVISTNTNAGIVSQAAINNTIRGTVYFKKGNYTNMNLIIYSGQFIKLAGEGFQDVNISCTTGTCISAISTNADRGLILDNLLIKGITTPSYGIDMYFLDTASYIKDVYVTGFDVGIRIQNQYPVSLYNVRSVHSNTNFDFNGVTLAWFGGMSAWSESTSVYSSKFQAVDGQISGLISQGNLMPMWLGSSVFALDMSGIHFEEPYVVNLADSNKRFSLRIEDPTDVTFPEEPFIIIHGSYFGTGGVINYAGKGVVIRDSVFAGTPAGDYSIRQLTSDTEMTLENLKFEETLGTNVSIANGMLEPYVHRSSNIQPPDFQHLSDTYFNTSRKVWCYYNGTGWNSTSDLISNC